jgi:hypothetical protein
MLVVTARVGEEHAVELTAVDMVEALTAYAADPALAMCVRTRSGLREGRDRRDSHAGAGSEAAAELGVAIVDDQRSGCLRSSIAISQIH